MSIPAEMPHGTLVPVASIERAENTPQHKFAAALVKVRARTRTLR